MQQRTSESSKLGMIRYNMYDVMAHIMYLPANTRTLSLSCNWSVNATFTILDTLANANYIVFNAGMGMWYLTPLGRSFLSDHAKAKASGTRTT
jgi:hypothetical protein